MKKHFLSMLAVLVSLSILAACSSDSSNPATEGSDADVPEDATEVVMWNLFSGGDAEYMQNIVDKFNEEQSEFFVNNIMQEHDEYYTKLLTSIGAGQGPDLAIAHDYILPELVSQGLAVDLGEAASEVGINWDEFNTNILDATIFDDTHYAVPIDTHAQIMYFNNEMVDQAGLLNDDGTLQMEESPEGFVAFLQELKSSLPDDKMPFAFSTTGNDPYWLWWGLYTQLGGEHILSEDDLENPAYALDREKAIQAAEFLQSLYHEEELIPLNIEDFYTEFQSKNAATILTGVWATGIWETTEDLDFTPMAIPQLYDNQGVWGSSHTLILPYYDDVDEDVQRGAAEFMKFAAESGAMWSQAGHIPAKDTVVESEEFQNMDYRSEYAEVASYVNFMDRTVHARGVEAIMVRHLETVWDGNATAEEAFDAIETEVKDLIGE